MVIFALLIYIICIFLLFYFKPSMMFDINGDIKSYNDNSFLTLEIVAPFIAILSYFAILVIIMIIT